MVQNEASSPVRIGMVNYINTAPIHETWKDTVNRPDWRMIEAPPSMLNRMLATDAIDLGFVSSLEYGLRPERYRIMADLSISATGPVGSVFLFARYPLEELAGKRIFLTGQSDTSVCLLKIILEEFCSIRPGSYNRVELFADPGFLEQADGVLAIGDEALRLAGQATFPVRIDLGEFWHRKTGLPFVFAVCAVREEFLIGQPGQAREVHQTLLSCRDLGLASLPAICKRVAGRIPMAEEACSRYFHAMQYDLGERKQEALARFFTLLIRRGEASERALPLKIYPGE